MRSKLTRAQQNRLVAWVTEGLTTNEINERAAQFEEPFSVSTELVAHYRKAAGVLYQDMVKEGRIEAIKEHLAQKSERIRVLQELAQRMIEDLFNGGMWVEDKRLGKGVRRFNEAEVAQLRGVLDDIARELGDRRGVDINISREQVIIYVPDNGRNKSI